METYFDVVVRRLTEAGYRWYETANFCRKPTRADGRDLRARHNLAYWQARDYLGVGIGAVSTIEGRRWRNAPRLGHYVAALSTGKPPPREHELLSNDVRSRERLMLGLRLDEPLDLAGCGDAVDRAALKRLTELGLADLAMAPTGGTRIALTRRGRLLGGGVTAELLA
jgi:oxygen-independent coproporphyrinogen-3 oxidase